MTKDKLTAYEMLEVSPGASSEDVLKKYVKKLDTVNRQIENAVSAELRSKYLEQKLRLERALAELLGEMPGPGLTDNNLPSDVPLRPTELSPRAGPTPELVGAQPSKKPRNKRAVLFATIASTALYMSWAGGWHYTVYDAMINPVCDIVDFCESYREETERFKNLYESHPARIGSDGAASKVKQAEYHAALGQYILASGYYQRAVRMLNEFQESKFNDFAGQRFYSDISFCNKKSNTQSRRAFLQYYDKKNGIIRGSYNVDSQCDISDGYYFTLRDQGIFEARQIRRDDFEGELYLNKLNKRIAIKIELLYWNDDNSPAFCLTEVSAYERHCYRIIR